MKSCWFGMFALLVVPWLLVGCQQATDKPVAVKPTGDDKVANEKGTESEEDAVIKEERAKLSPEDRKLVDAQDYCPIMPTRRLGGMGEPVKVMIKDQPVFVCCKGCQKKALKDPDKTLAKVEEMKAQTKKAEPKN